MGASELSVEYIYTLGLEFTVARLCLPIAQCEILLDISRIACSPTLGCDTRPIKLLKSLKFSSSFPPMTVSQTHSMIVHRLMLLNLSFQAADTELRRGTHGI